MSTFEETIANLRQNNRFSTQQIKTYNLDEARFESARLQKQGELWALAGNLGADLVEKIAARREKDAINDEYITYYENKYEEYLTSDDALAAENLFKSNANNQNILSDGLVNVEGAGGPSDDVTEARMSTGKHIRIREQLKTNLLNLLLTERGERINRPDYGIGLKKLLFEPRINKEYLKELIANKVRTYIPDLLVSNIIFNNPPDDHTLQMFIEFRYRLDNTVDSVQLNFN